MSELSALAGSEGYEVCADDAQGVQPPVRSEATQENGCSDRHSPLRRTHIRASAADPYRSAPFGKNVGISSLKRKDSINRYLQQSISILL